MLSPPGFCLTTRLWNSQQGNLANLLFSPQSWSWTGLTIPWGQQGAVHIPGRSLLLVKSPVLTTSFTKSASGGLGARCPLHSSLGAKTTHHPLWRELYSRPLVLLSQQAPSIFTFLGLLIWGLGHLGQGLLMGDRGGSLENPSPHSDSVPGLLHSQPSPSPPPYPRVHKTRGLRWLPQQWDTKPPCPNF